MNDEIHAETYSEVPLSQPCHMLRRAVLRGNSYVPPQNTSDRWHPRVIPAPHLPIIHNSGQLPLRKDSTNKVQPLDHQGSACAILEGLCIV